MCFFVVFSNMNLGEFGGVQTVKVLRGNSSSPHPPPSTTKKPPKNEQMSNCCCIIVQRRVLHHSCFEPRRNPSVALPIHTPPTHTPASTCQHHQPPCDRTFFCRSAENSLPPPTAASCLGSLLFSQEISQTSPEVDPVHSKISACQGV